MSHKKSPVPEFCSDCLYYLPVDVFKGMCKVDKKECTPETPFCTEGKMSPKCKFCTHFTAQKEFIGLCMEKHTTYPDLSGRQCKDFTQIVSS